MEFIKKNLQPLTLGIATLFSLLVLVFMTGAGYVIKLGNARSVLTVYQCMTHNGYDGSIFGLVLALIFTILCIVIAFTLVAITLLNKELPFAKWIQLGAAVLALVAGILFFCTASMYTNYIGITGSLGAGAIFAAIFSLLNVCLFACAPVMELIKK